VEGCALEVVEYAAAIARAGMQSRIKLRNKLMIVLGCFNLEEPFVRLVAEEAFSLSVHLSTRPLLSRLVLKFILSELFVKNFSTIAHIIFIIQAVFSIFILILWSLSNCVENNKKIKYT